MGHFFMEKSLKWGKAEGQGTEKSGKETIKQFKAINEMYCSNWLVLFSLKPWEEY